MKKAVLIIIGLTIIAGVIYLSIARFSQDDDLAKYSPEIRTCIQEWRSKQLVSGEDYVIGEIIVAYNDVPPPSSEIIKVSAGSEFQVICEMLQDPRVRYAEPNAILRASY